MASQPTPQPYANHELWNRLVLPRETRRFLEQLIAALRAPETTESRAFLSLHGRILLSGPPGTGKTLVLRAIAEQAPVAFIPAGRADLVPCYIGQGANQVRQLFQRARDQAPSILAIDEIEQVCPPRLNNDDYFTAEVVCEVLMELEFGKEKGLFPVILAETNRPERIDEAVLSRFGTRIELGYPDAESRRAILRNLLADKPVDFDINQVSRELAEKTGQVSGRDLNSLVHYAAQTALERALGVGASENVKLTRQDLLDYLPQIVRTQ